MKRKIDLVEEEHEREDEENESSSDESEDEEPIIKDVLSHLFQAVSEKRASELLHSMAASKGILFWTPRGQLPRNTRIIPVTNIAELVEYVLLPHNNDVTKPRALITFLDGLAELGVNKGLIKNKKLLALKRPPPFTLKIPVNIERTLKCRGGGGGGGGGGKQ